jgi:hypothetical protein
MSVLSIVLEFTLVNISIRFLVCAFAVLFTVLKGALVNLIL